MQYSFYSYALLSDLLWLFVERAFIKSQEKLERHCLERHFERS